MPELLLMRRLKQMNSEVDTVDKDNTAPWVTAQTENQTTHSLRDSRQRAPRHLSSTMAVLIGSIMRSNWVVHVEDLEWSQIPNKN